VLGQLYILPACFRHRISKPNPLKTCQVPSSFYFSAERAIGAICRRWRWITWKRRRCPVPQAPLRNTVRMILNVALSSFNRLPLVRRFDYFFTQLNQAINAMPVEIHLGPGICTCESLKQESNSGSTLRPTGTTLLQQGHQKYRHDTSPISGLRMRLLLATRWSSRVTWIRAFASDFPLTFLFEIHKEARQPCQLPVSFQ